MDTVQHGHQWLPTRSKRMYFLKKPSDDRIRHIVDELSQRDFTYPAVGATRNQDSPAGFLVDHNRIRLGTGRTTFETATRALQSWQHYRFDWITLHRPAKLPAAGQTVGVLARALGLWVLNVCKVVYVIEEENSPVRRFAFAYGTLPEHAEAGEERFQVEWREDDDSVWYDIFAFSRPNQLFSRVGYPYVRIKQKQFARESMLAMNAAVSETLSRI